MSFIYLESTLNLMMSFAAETNGIKEKTEKLIQQGEVKQLENGVKYLKIEL